MVCPKTMPLRTRFIIAEERNITVVTSPKTNNFKEKAVIQTKQERMLQLQKDIEIASACLSL